MSKTFDPMMKKAVICLYQNKFSYEKIVDLFCNKCTSISKPTVQRIVNEYQKRQSQSQPQINNQIKNISPVLKEKSSIELKEDQNLIVNSCSDELLSNRKNTYDDQITEKFKKFLNENKNLIKKYDESQIWDIAKSMTIAAEEHKITESQMKKVVIELYKHTDKINLKTISQAICICKKQELI